MDEITKIAKEMYEKYPFPIQRRFPRCYQDKNIEMLEHCFRKHNLSFENQILLDAGCGTGGVTVALAQIESLRSLKEIVAIDISRESLKKARRFFKIVKLLKQRPMPNITFSVENIMSLLSFKERTFDIVASIGVLHHLSSPEIGFKNLVRVLKPEGIIISWIYGYFGRWEIEIKRQIVNMLEEDRYAFEEKMEIARRLFAPSDKKETKAEANEEFYSHIEALSSDVMCVNAYASPQGFTFTIKDILTWFEKNKVELVDFVGLDTTLSSHIKDDYVLRKAKKLSQIDRLRLIELLVKPEGYFFVGRKIG